MLNRTSSIIRSSYYRTCVHARRRFAAEAAKVKEAAPSGGGGNAALGVAMGAGAAAVYVYSMAEMQRAELQLIGDKLAQQIAVADELRVQLSGKTNSAFVFIKPHACKGKPGKVEEIVEESFRKNGIRILGSGEMLAETIDQNKHIDTHYGAIASKAVLLKPSELNVPDKGKAQFQDMFGESWDDAVAAGKVYNAADGAVKLGVNSDGLNQKWSKLKRGKDLIKFGGGFYCGKVGDIYIS